MSLYSTRCRDGQRFEGRVVIYFTDTSPLQRGCCVMLDTRYMHGGAVACLAEGLMQLQLIG